MSDISQAAIEAAQPLAERLALQYGLPEEIDHEEVHAFTVAMLEAAAPHNAAADAETIRAVERARLASSIRQYLLDLADGYTGLNPGNIAVRALHDAAERVTGWCQP